MLEKNAVERDAMDLVVDHVSFADICSCHVLERVLVERSNSGKE